MKVAVFGDIHGNIIALEKFLKNEQDHCDLFVCHGDVVNYGPWSNECVALLSSVENCICLQGNHEEYFIKNAYDGTHPVASAFFKQCIQYFSPESLHLIRKYKQEVKVGDYMIKHTLDSRYWFLDSDFSSLSLEGNIIIGHSHQQFKTTIGGFTFCNTGSIGQNRKYINRGNYVVVDTDTQEIQMKEFAYDIDKVINEMKQLGYPEICINYYVDKERK